MDTETPSPGNAPNYPSTTAERREFLTFRILDLISAMEHIAQGLENTVGPFDAERAFGHSGVNTILEIMRETAKELADLCDK